ncbi:MAG TPA: histidine phosphatase family protein [Thermomicrobiales bacterium]
MLERLTAHPTGGRTTLYLVRHGRTQANHERRLLGSTDAPLDTLGIQQAQRIAERLAAEIRADVLLTSPLQRALMTAQAISERIGLEPRTIPGLAEMNFGDMEGLLFDELLARHPELAKRALDASSGDFAWPNGESLLGFHQRVRSTFASILTEYASHSAVVVTHGGVLGSLLSQLEARPANDWRTYTIMNCSLTHVEFNGDGAQVYVINDCRHLGDLAEAVLTQEAS